MNLQSGDKIVFKTENIDEITNGIYFFEPQQSQQSSLAGTSSLVEEEKKKSESNYA